MQKPFMPALADLYRFGLVSTIGISLGILFVSIGAFGDLSLSNRKLSLGAMLICFGVIWHYGGRMTGVVIANVESERYFAWNHILTVLLFFALAMAFACMFFAQKVPFPSQWHLGAIR